MYLKLLGTPSLELSGRAVNFTRKKAMALLAFLAITRKAHDREHICTLLWPDSDTSSGRRSLRSVLTELRKILPDGLLGTDGSVVHLNDDVGLEVDTRRFTDDTTAPETAVDLYDGDFMTGFFVSGCREFDDWVFRTSEALKNRFAALMRLLIERHRKNGDFDAAISKLNRIIALDPLDEASHRGLMEVLAESGARSSAIRQYERCRELLEVELDTEPDALTNELYRKIRASNPISESEPSRREGGKEAADTSLERRPERAEIRVVTLLVLGLSEESDADWELRDDTKIETIESIHAEMLRQVELLNGRVASIMADDIVAIFGHPESHEDDPERAALTALALRTSANARNLGVSISISTGPVMFQSGVDPATSDMTPIGALVNTAMRRRYSALTDEIVIDRQTYKRIRGLCICGPPEGRHGVSARDWITTLVGWIGTIGEPPDIKRSPFIGRDAEREEIIAWWNKTGTSFRFLALTGEAGVGKTRLIREARLAINDSSDPAPLWVAGQCTEREKQISFAPLIKVLNVLFSSNAGVESTVAAESAVGKLLAAGAIDAADRDSAVGVLSLVFGGDGSDDRGAIASTRGDFTRRAFSLLKELLKISLPPGPLVLVIEDLHWADELSIDFLSFCADLEPDHPLLIIVTFRPDERSPDIATPLTYAYADRFSNISLSGLTDEEERKLISHLIADRAVYRRRSAEIAQRAKGNPFFIEELAESLTEGFDATISKRMAGDVLPDSVQKLLQSKIDGQDSLTRRILQAASVLGIAFQFEVLVGLCRSSGIADVPEIIRKSLQRTDAVDLVARFPEELYGFRHALLHDAFHATMPGKLHKELHSEAGKVLEALPEKLHRTMIETLADHFHAGGIHGKAAEYLEAAGDAARDIFSIEHAIERYSQALEHAKLGGDQSNLEHLYFKLATVYHQDYRFSESAAAYREAFEAQRSAGAAVPAKESGLPILRMENPLGADLLYTDIPVEEAIPLILCTHTLMFRLTSTGEVVPELVRDWSVSSDGLLYTFTLRDDFGWTDGRMVTARDAIEGIKRHYSRQQHNPDKDSFAPICGLKAFLETGSDDRLGLIEEGKYAMTIRLERPYPVLLHLLCVPFLAPIPSHLVDYEKGSCLRLEHGVTSGPFSIAEVAENGALSLARNPDFSGHAPGNLRELSFLSRSSSDTETHRRYRDGSCDVLQIRTQELAEDLDGDVVSPNQTGVACLRFNLSKPEFLDTDFRKALALSIDRSRLIKDTAELTVAAGGIIPPGLPGYRESRAFSFDPSAAEELLASSAFATAPRPVELHYFGIHDVWERMALELKRGWKEFLGIETTATRVGAEELYTRLASGNYDMALYLVSSSVTNPAVYIDTDNRVGDPILEKLVQENRGAVPVEAFLDSAAKLDEYCTETARCVPLAYSNTRYIKKPRIKELPFDPIGNIAFNEMVVEPAAAPAPVPAPIAPRQETPKAQESVKATEIETESNLPILRIENPLGVEMLYTEAPIADVFPVALCTNALLFRMTSNAEVVPELVRDWSVSDDGLFYAFTLRDDFKWTDGKPVTAADAVEGLKRHILRRLGTDKSFFSISGLNNFMTTGSETALGLTNDDDHVLTIRLDEPYPALLHILCVSTTAPIPSHLVDYREGSWLGLEHGITCGPFSIDKVDDDGALYFKRNPGFPGYAPGNLQELCFYPAINDEKVNLRRYRDGSCDIMEFGWELRLPDDLAGELVTRKSFGVSCLIFGPSTPLLRDTNLRKALMLSIDRSRLKMEDVEILPATGGMIPPGMPGHRTSGGYSFDAESAREHLSASSYIDNPRSFELLYFRGFRIVEHTILELQRSWREVLGIDTTAVRLTFKEVVDRLVNGDFEIALIGISSSMLDPAAYIYRGLSMGDKILENLLLRKRRAITMEEYLDSVVEIDEYCTREAFSIPLAYKNTRYLKKPWIRELPFDPVGNIAYNEVVVEPVESPNVSRHRWERDHHCDATGGLHPRSGTLLLYGRAQYPGCYSQTARETLAEQ